LSQTHFNTTATNTHSTLNIFLPTVNTLLTAYTHSKLLQAVGPHVYDADPEAQRLLAERKAVSVPTGNTSCEIKLTYSRSTKVRPTISSPATSTTAVRIWHELE
jgi:hypothetical protein